MIARFLGNLLSIKPNEWDGVLYFFLVLLVFSFGASFARSIGMTLLVQHLGGDTLPVMFISIDFAVMMGSMVYAHYTKTASGLTILGFFLLSTAIFSIIIQFLFFLMSFNHLGWRWMYGFFFVGFSFFYILISIHVGSVIASYFTAVQVKRLTAVINSGLPIGGALGGTSLIVLLKIFHFQPQQLVIVLGWACLGAFGLLHLIHARLSPVRIGRAEAKSHKSPIEELVAAFKYITNSRLMIFMSLGLMLFVIGNKLLEYQYQTIIYFEIFPNATQRATFFATYEVFANLTWLVIQLFFTSRIVVSLGVGASNVLYPVLSAIVALALFVFFYWKVPDYNHHSELVMLSLGIFTQFINQEMRGALRTPANNLLFNAIPPNLWGINKAFLNGIIYPFATLLAGSFLILITEKNFSLAGIQMMLPKEQQSYLLPLIVLLVSLLGILVALPQWAAYNQGVFGLLNRELFGRQTDIRGGGRGGHALRNVLEEKLGSSDQYHVIAALEMIRVLRLSYFVNQIGSLLLQTQIFQIKERCINTLAALPQTNASVNYLVEALKTEQDAEVLPSLLKHLAQFKTININELVEKRLEHSAPKVFVEACLYLYGQPLYQDKVSIENRLIIRLKEPDLSHIAIYLYGLGELRQPKYSDIVLPFLDHYQTDIRLAAFAAYIRMQEGYLQPHKGRLINALSSSDKEMKIIALRALKECQLEGQSLEDWMPIIYLLGAKDRALVNESKELLRLSMGTCKNVLITQIFAEEVPVQQRFEILSLVYPRLTEEQKRKLREKADTSLKNFVEINGLLRLHHARKHTSKVYDLINKVLQEIAENHLLHVLTEVTFASDKNLEFFQRVSRGLFSSSRANQGNALEVLSNAGEKYLTNRILKYFEEERSSIDIQAINRIYLILFGEILKINDRNYEAQLVALDHEMLKACLLYMEYERTKVWPLEKVSDKVRQLLT
jgi:hypothetical protein